MSPTRPRHRIIVTTNDARKQPSKHRADSLSALSLEIGDDECAAFAEAVADFMAARQGLVPRHAEPDQIHSRTGSPYPMTLPAQLPLQAGNYLHLTCR